MKALEKTTVSKTPPVPPRHGAGMWQLFVIYVLRSMREPHKQDTVAKEVSRLYRFHLPLDDISIPELGLGSDEIRRNSPAI